MDQKIPLYLIESFIVAAEATSFEAAAKLLGITQSTLSKQMIALQRNLPHKIFTLHGRKKNLTKYGDLLYQSLSQKFSDTQDIINQASLLYVAPKDLHLKICGRGELLDILAQKIKSPASISYIATDSRTALDSVVQRKVDIAITHEDSDSSEVIRKTFITNEFVFAISKSILKQKPKGDAELAQILKKYPSLQYKEDDAVTKKLLKTWGLSIADLKISRTYSNYAALSKMVSQGLGWAIVPSHIHIDPKDNHILPIANNNATNERRFYIYYRKEISSAFWLKNLIMEIK